MKKIIALALFLSGCTSTYESIGESYLKAKILDINNDVISLQEGCIKLGKCIGGKYALVHFRNQKHAPYVCEVSYGPNWTHYFYPDTALGFGSLGSRRFENAITACELATKTGEYSAAEIKKRIAMYEAMEKDLLERRKPKPAPKQEVIDIKEQ